MAKKTPKRKAMDKLEKIVKTFVKLRDKNTCQHCYKHVEGSDCHASHVIPVSRDGRLAFDSLNLKVLCMRCHMHWWHKHPIEAGQWFTDTFPVRWAYLEEEHKKNRTKGPIRLSFYKEEIERYKFLASVSQNMSIEDLPF